MKLILLIIILTIMVQGFILMRCVKFNFKGPPPTRECYETEEEWLEAIKKWSDNL